MALIACSSRSAITPRKLPFRTTTRTPGIPLTEVSSSATKRALKEGGRTIRPCNMPGKSMSCMKAAPVTFLAMSKRCKDCPTKV